MDSFGEWMRAVSGILENAGVEGFNDNRDIFLERADVSGDEDDEFVNRWYDLHGEEQQAPRTLLLLAEDVFTLVAKDERGRAKSLGHRLKKLVDRVFNVNGTPVAVRRVLTRSSTYFLERLQGAPQGTVSLCATSNPSHTIIDLLSETAGSSLRAARLLNF